MAGPDTTSNPLDKYFAKVTRYHYFFFTIFLVTKLATVWPTLNIVFISPHNMKYTCGDKVAKRADGNQTDDKLVNKCPCDNPVWDTSTFTKTVQMTYKTICKDKYLISISESLTFAGLLVGSMLFGYMADKFGRLLLYVISNIIIGVFGLLIIIVPNMYWFILLRFFQGCGCGGTLVTGYVLCMEYCGPGYRAIMGSLIQLPSNIGLIIMAGISYLIRDYRYFQIAISIPSILTGTMYFCIYESPKWTLIFDKQRTLMLMKKFCRFNNNPCPTLEADIASYQGTQASNSVKFYNIFKYPAHTKNFVLLAYVWFVCGMGYYGISQFIGEMTIHPHLNTAINGMFTAVGTIFCMLVISYVGRKPFLGIVNLLAGVCILLVIVFPDTMKYSVARVFLACLASSLFYVDFIVVYIYSVELFPTNIRNSIFGMLSVICRVGQILSPMINSLSLTLAGFVFGVSGIVAALLTLLLPETRGIELLSTLDDAPPKNNFLFFGRHQK